MPIQNPIQTQIGFTLYPVDTISAPEKVRVVIYANNRLAHIPVSAIINEVPENPTGLTRVAHRDTSTISIGGSGTSTDPLYASAINPGITRVYTESTDTIDLSGAGTQGNPIKADLINSSSFLKTVNVKDSTTVKMTGDGTENNPIVSEVIASSEKVILVNTNYKYKVGESKSYFWDNFYIRIRWNDFLDFGSRQFTVWIGNSNTYQVSAQQLWNTNSSTDYNYGGTGEYQFAQNIAYGTQQPALLSGDLWDVSNDRTYRFMLFTRKDQGFAKILVKRTDSPYQITEGTSRTLEVPIIVEEENEDDKEVK